MMDKEQIIQRLCKLQEEVRNKIKTDSGADCFCGEGGFWEIEGYDGTWEKGYRNDGECLEFIENAVREKIKSLTESAPKEEEEVPFLENTIWDLEECVCCNGTGKVDGEHIGEIESCLTCNGKGHF